MSEHGPRFTVTASCFSCVHCVSERYQVQGDSGHDVMCKHPDGSKKSGGHIGDTNWNTPAWCPFLKDDPSR